MDNQEDSWLKERRKNIHKIKQRQKEYNIEQEAINACEIQREIQREKEQKLMRLYLKFKRIFHLK